LVHSNPRRLNLNQEQKDRGSGEGEQYQKTPSHHHDNPTLVIRRLRVYSSDLMFDLVQGNRLKYTPTSASSLPAEPPRRIKLTVNFSRIGATPITAVVSNVSIEPSRYSKLNIRIKFDQYSQIDEAAYCIRRVKPARTDSDRRSHSKT